MVNKYVGAGKLIFGAGKKIIQKLSGQGKTTGTEVIIKDMGYKVEKISSARPGSLAGSSHR